MHSKQRLFILRQPLGGFPDGPAVKNPRAKQETPAQPLPASGRPPGEGNGNHSSVLAWRIPWTEEPGGLQSTGSQRARHDLVTEQQQKNNKRQLLWHLK